MIRLRNPLRSLYAKIFLWFCATVALTLSVTLAVAAIVGSQPFGRRWMGLTQDLYAHSAVDFYRTGGAPALARYLQVLQTNSGIEGHLLDSAGNDVLDRPLPPQTAAVLAQSRRLGQSTFRLSAVWTAASPVQDGGVSYTFLILVHPLRAFNDGIFVRSMMPRIALGVALVALCCLLLARHVTRPILILEHAATQLAEGSLSVRAGPRIAPRRDELAHLAHAFDRMADRIQRLLLTQQEMLGHISHELRSPLTRIGVSLELLRRGEPESPARSEIDRMEVDLDRVNRMIGQILDLTRLDLQQLEISSPRDTFAPVDLALLLEAIARDAAFEARRLHHRVATGFAPGCAILGDPALLRSACENIVRNALLYTPPGSAIHIRLLREPPHAVILIQDEGPGVPPETLPHLFELFYRAAATAGSHPQGTGFGLAIAQRIVLLHRGSIAARNLAPHGLELRIEIPLAQ